MDVHPRSRLKFAARADICSFCCLTSIVLCLRGAHQALPVSKSLADGSTTQPIAIQLTLSDVVQPISADHIVRGIRHANQVNARAILLTIDTPGGLESSMRERSEERRVGKECRS